MIGVGKILSAAIQALFRKPATEDYPFIRNNRPLNFRGRLQFDASKCIGCKLCMRDCPSHAIEIIEVAEKRYKAVVRLDKCIYCAQCCDSCNKRALTCTTQFELANFKREDLKMEI